MLAGVTPAQAATKVTVLDVFLAVGQSNVSGRGLPSGTTDDPADPRIFQYGAKLRTFRNATIPLDMLDVAKGISPATTFARGYVKNQPANVGVLIIPAARGATAFTNSVGTPTWNVGTASAPEFDLPALAVTQTREGIAAAVAAGYTVKLKGILWHQGEGNWWMSTSAYSAKLDELIGYFRSQLAAPQLPFVVGGLAPEGITAQPGLANVDKSHKGTPSRVAYTAFAPSMAGGVNDGDAFHFSRTGDEFLGRTYLTAFWRAAKITYGPVPIITGTAKVGSTLTAVPGAWAVSPVTLSYQWYHSGTAVVGATAATYVVPSGDLGRTITVKVTGAKTGYTTTSRTSAGTKVAQ
ncbi:hypothetical protein GCM10009825_06920 [Arthrobacter humicola]|uniref:Sialate O-acetylesterase domain-containing protein n=1 Tax=Arthrobacter humicola TaxID=409291 RepID=A0ABN2YJJ6_9MICC